MAKNTPTKIGYVPREIEKEFSKYLQRRPIIALLGPRRSGKTTLLLHLKAQLNDAVYLSFEDRQTLDLFEKDIKNFARLYLEGKTQYLFLDEFHYAKSGGKNLKYLFDFYPLKRIIISGSSSLDLTIQALKYLVGRVVSLTLYPFSFSEFLLAKEEKLYQIWETTPTDQLANSPLAGEFIKLFEEYALWGGYPEVVLEKDEEVKKKFLAGIYNILFLREVKDFLSLADDYKLRQLIKALALQTGNLINYQELSQVSGLDYKTLKRYLNFLEKVFVCYLTPPFFRNKRKELVKTPKLYFGDTGLRNAILNNFSPLTTRTDMGGIKENFVFRHLKPEFEVKFWQSKAKAEVDFVIERDGQIIPVEVKSGLRAAKLTASLSSFLNTYHPKNAVVLTNDFSDTRGFGKTTVYFVPLWHHWPKLAPRQS